MLQQLAGYEYEVRPDTQDMNDFLGTFTNKINGMFLTNENTNRIYELSIQLAREMKKLTDELWERQTCDNFADALTMATNFVVDKLLQNVSTYKRSNNFEQHQLFIAPEQKAIGTHWEMCKIKSINTSVPRLLQSKMHYIPITDRIQSLFKQPEFKNLYFEHNSVGNKHVCEKGRYRDFCCGDVYRTSELFINNPDALQIQLATDGFELCNPIGSKATIHNMCPIYFQIKNMPKQFLSKASNVYLVALCRSDDIKTEETDFNDLWRLIVNDLKKLEEKGICIDDNKVIKGTAIYIGFDNLGANSSLGFVESFGATNFCRFCTASKKETETMVIQDSKKLRTIEEYESHLKIVSESTKIDFNLTKGVKRPCALNELNFFHSLENKSVDIMHDLNEGAIPFLLQHLFAYCIKKKLVTEASLKKRILFYDFGIDRKNAPSTLNLKKSNLNQSATQLLCLFRNIGFIFSDFELNEKLDKAWKCIESLQTIVQIAYSTDIHEDDLVSLTNNTSTFLKGK